MAILFCAIYCCDVRPLCPPGSLEHRPLLGQGLPNVWQVRLGIEGCDWSIVVTLMMSPLWVLPHEPHNCIMVRSECTKKA